MKSSEYQLDDLIILIMRDHDTFSEATLLIDAFKTIFLNLPHFRR